MTKTEAYFQAASQSFAGQTRQLVLPPGMYGGIFVQELGYQPMGIASKLLSDGRDLVAIADYYMPAVHLATVERVPEGFRFLFTRIGGVLYQDPVTGEDQSKRVFPDVSEPSGANRLYTVNFGPDDTIWVSRGDREFFILTPPAGGQERWRLASRVVLPPGSGKENRFMEAALLQGRDLVTIEVSPDSKTWLQVSYSGQNFEHWSESPVDPWTFGFGYNQGRRGLWTVRDYRAAAVGISPGLYRHDKLVNSAILGGNGVCFLSDGTALVTCYGSEYPDIPGGKPGKLILVPTNLL